MLSRGSLLVRAGVVLALAAGAATVGPAAHADRVVCPRDGGPCTVVAERPGAPGRPASSGDSDASGDGGSGAGVCRMGNGEPVACHDEDVGSWNNQDRCYYRPDPDPPPAGDPAWRGHAPGDGAIYQRYCPEARTVERVWLPGAPDGGAGTVPTPAELAARAVELLPIRGPDIGMVPRPGGMGLVGLPVWLWTRVSPQTWGPVSRTVSVPGLSVTATAKARRIVWDMGDGHTVSCDSPGTPYKPRFGDRPSPTCGHVYARASSAEPDRRYTITGTTTWGVRWVGGGESGELTVTRSSSTSVRIGELQVLVQ